MRFKFSKKSWARLDKVHPKLVAVAALALQKTPIDFGIERGIRTLEEQREYVAKGWSRTMRSRHLPQRDGLSHAIDVKAYGKGVAPYGTHELLAIINAFRQAAKDLDVECRFGADWLEDPNDPTSGWDKPHIELHRP